MLPRRSRDSAGGISKNPVMAQVQLEQPTGPPGYLFPIGREGGEDLQRIAAQIEVSQPLEPGPRR